MTGLLNDALSLAKAGWAVFPCNPNNKAPLTQHGHLEATRGEHILQEWWEQWPDAIIGAKVPERLLVLDIDPRNGGSYEALEAMTPEPLPETLEVHSGRGDGGRHLYFQRPKKIERFTGSRLPDGIDLKVNGYLIMPPSPHPDTGKPYRWIRRPVAAMPAPLIAKLIPAPRRMREPGETLTDPSRLAFTVASAAAGERNSILYWAACRAAEENASDTVYEALIDAAVAAGLSQKEAERTVESAREAVEV